MAKHDSDHDLNKMLFEELPSDDESISSFNDTEDDETYFLECNNNTLLVIESDSDTDKNVDIFKYRSSLT